MKKLIANLVVLLLLGLVVFFIGWLPLRIRPGLYAVLASKTGGIHEQVIAPGTFFWTPAALLPTNIELHRFSAQSVERKIELSGLLPSAELYQDFLAGEPDFSWEASVRLAATFRAEALPTLVSQYGVVDDLTMAVYLASELVRAVDEVRAIIMHAAADVEKVQRLIDGSLSSELVSLVEASRPQLRVLEVAVLSARVPDIAVYNQARQLYAAYLASYQAQIEPALVTASTAAVSDQVRIDTLRRYGELVTQYPALVDYLAIEAGLPPRDGSQP